MEDRRGAVRYEEDSARGSIYPLQSLGPSSRRCILAKTPSTLNLERIRPRGGCARVGNFREFTFHALG